MEKKVYLLICSALFITGIVSGKILSDSTQTQDVKTVTIISENTVVRTIEVPKVIKIETIKEVERIPEIEITDDEKKLIAKVVQAEAGNQDYIGKRLVVDVILNRYNSETFANSIAGVVYSPGQFTHPSTYYTDDCLAAVEAECMERLDYELLYFRAGYFFAGHEQAYQHGDHFFSYQ